MNSKTDPQIDLDALIPPPEDRPSTPPDAIPQELRDHPKYAFIKKIAIASAGVVYLAQDRVSQRELAIKVITNEVFRGEASQTRFQFENTLRVKLNHPNLIRTFSNEICGSYHLNVMELVQGRDLSSLVQENGPLPIELACDYLFQTARGLEHIHNQRVVHRDLTMTNLILTPSGTIKIFTDFGLVESIDYPFYVEFDPRQHLGTLSYMAPEQFRSDERIDYRTDIYALGCCLYYLLLGRFPYSGSLLDIVQAQHAGGRPSVKSSRSEVPLELEKLVQRMLARSPDDRPQSAREIWQLLSPKRDSHSAPGAARQPPPPRIIRGTVDDEDFSELSMPAERQALQPEPIRVDENVQFTVYRPKNVEPERWYDLFAFAHLAEKRPDAPEDEPDPLEEVQNQAKRLLGEKASAYQSLVQDSLHAVPEKGDISFVPEVEGVEFNPPRRTFLWVETVHREDFRFKANSRLNGQTIRGRLSVYLGAILLADVPLVFRVTSATIKPLLAPPLEKEVARPYRKIFASYSHRDLSIVEQFEQLALTLGDEYIRDWKHLRTGQVWNDELRRLISNADVFQLFWSSNSMISEYCKQEWEYAISLDRPHFVRPTYWQKPLPSRADLRLPPQNLARIHFQFIGLISPPSQPVPSDPARPKAPVAKEILPPPTDQQLPAVPVIGTAGRYSSILDILIGEEEIQEALAAAAKREKEEMEKKKAQEDDGLTPEERAKQRWEAMDFPSYPSQAFKAMPEAEAPPISKSPPPVLPSIPVPSQPTSCTPPKFEPAKPSSGWDSLPIQTTCQACGKSFKVRRDFAGKKGKCPSCNAIISIPNSPAAVPPLEPSPHTVSGPANLRPLGSPGEPLPLREFSRREMTVSSRRDMERDADYEISRTRDNDLLDSHFDESQSSSGRNLDESQSFIRWIGFLIFLGLLVGFILLIRN